MKTTLPQGSPIRHYDVARAYTAGILAGMTVTEKTWCSPENAPRVGDVVKKAIGGGSYKIVRVTEVFPPAGFPVA